jgi:L-ascorbate metabolism protein UlaG (beta-lactamase superfamily)
VLEQEDWRLELISVPGVHGPGMIRHLMPPVMGTVLELTQGAGPTHRTYISGDTLHRPWLRDVIDRTGPLDAAVLHLGGTRVLGILLTMDDQQGADLAELLGAGLTLPIHQGDYGVFRSPVDQFHAECAARGLTGVRPLQRGDRVPLTIGEPR